MGHLYSDPQHGQKPRPATERRCQDCQNCRLVPRRGCPMDAPVFRCKAAKWEPPGVRAAIYIPGALALACSDYDDMDEPIEPLEGNT